MDEPSCAGCRELLKRIAELEARLRDLEARLGQNSSNSSMPPSANPPQAPPPVRKKPTGRKPGGQPGHDAHLRQRLPPERVTEPIIHYLPDICEACQRGTERYQRCQKRTDLLRFGCEVDAIWNQRVGVFRHTKPGEPLRHNLMAAAVRCSDWILIMASLGWAEACPKG